MVRYFDQDGDLKLTFHDFLQILLPCDDAVLRAAATQRPIYKLGKEDCLPMRIEKALTNLLVKEVKLQMKAENLKRILESSYDFQVQSAFKAIDDWNYNYIDEQNLRRFLRNVGHIASKQELVAIIRRIDTDGDAKMNSEEFAEGIKSQFSLMNNGSSSKQGNRKKSSASKINTSQISRSYSRAEVMLSQSASKRSVTPMKSLNTSSAKIKNQKSKKKRPSSANKINTGTKHRNEVLSRIYGGADNSEIGSQSIIEQSSNRYHESSYIEDSPSKLNKSVTFNNQVRVREYEIGNNGIAQVKESSEFSTPSKYEREESRFSNQNSYVESRTSPLKVLNVIDQRPNLAADFKQTADIYNHNNSPLRSSQTKQQDHLLNRSPPSALKQTSPLRVPSPGRSVAINYLDSSNSSFNNERLRIQQQVQQETSMMFDRMEQAEVAKVFKDTIFIERELETAKIDLSLKPDFNLLDSFRILDPYHKGFVTPQDLIDNLRRNLQFDYIAIEDIALLFRRYDRNSNGKLTFSEYCNAIIPSSKEYAQLITGRQEFFSKKGVDPSQFFNNDTRNEIRNLWRLLMQTERAGEGVRARVAKRPHFNLKSAFQYCDKDSDGVIKGEDIRDMLAEHGFFATEKELRFIFNKFDKDMDQKISYSEFLEEMSPKIII